MSSLISTTRDVPAEKQLQAWYQSESALDPLVFLEGLVVSGAEKTGIFGDMMAHFQRECFQDIAPSLMAVAKGDIPPKRRFWVERTKKAGKDSDLAAMILWLLAFAKRPLYIQAAAGDRDQASIIKRRLESLLHVNPWIQSLVMSHQYKARSTNGLGELDILAADVAGAHGGTPDLLVVNELSHVTKWEFVENLMDNADGVPRGVTIIASNAGYVGTKAHVWKQNAEQSKDWSCHYWRQPAPWISMRDVEDARRRDSPQRFARLWYGEWVSGKGDAFTDEMILRCFTQTGPMIERQTGWRYVAGLDLGVSHDHSALAVLGTNPSTSKIRLVWWRAWEPPDGGEVDLQEVEQACLEASRRYRVEWFGYDPSQAKLMAQRLKRQGVAAREVPFTGDRLNRMANTLKEAMESRLLELYDDQEGRLRRDFGKLNLVEKSYGYRLEAVSDETGHADIATALVIALPVAVDMLHRVGLTEEDVLADNQPLTDEDLETMPDELRDIYEGSAPPKFSRRQTVRRSRTDDDDD